MGLLQEILDCFYEVEAQGFVNLLPDYWKLREELERKVTQGSEWVDLTEEQVKYFQRVHYVYPGTTQLICSQFKENNK